MSIQYHDALVSDADIITLSESLKAVQGSYICVCPSIGIKECDREETQLARLYEQYPHADYYGQYSSTGKRAKPGEFTKYQPTANSPGIINMFIKVYPGTKTYPNDNSALRLANFSSVLRKLAELTGVTSLHILPTGDSYASTVEDYISTCKLNGSNVVVHIYGTPAPPCVTSGAIKYRLEYAEVSNVILYEVDFAKVDKGDILLRAS